MDYGMDMGLVLNPSGLTAHEAFHYKTNMVMKIA